MAERKEIAILSSSFDMEQITPGKMRDHASYCKRKVIQTQCSIFDWLLYRSPNLGQCHQHQNRLLDPNVHVTCDLSLTPI